MKKFLIITIIATALSGIVFGGVYLGGGAMKEFGGYNRTFLEGRITVGSTGLSADLLGQVDLSNLDPTHFLQLYTYVNVNLPISLFELYAGFSPCWFFYNGGFMESSLKSHGYVHGGVSFNFKPVRVYGEVSCQLIYSPISLGTVPMGTLGIQVGF